jgi:hypothetical protein
VKIAGLTSWLVLSGFAFLPCLADTALDQACASYAQHDYARSLKLIDALPALSRSVKSDYYRALNLQALHRFGEARGEYAKVASQKKDLRLAALARQGMTALSRTSLQGTAREGKGNKVAAAPVLKTDAAGNVVDENWKVQKPGFGGTGINREGLPENWTFVKTSSGCGRH